MASLDKQATNRLHPIFTAQISSLLDVDPHYISPIFPSLDNDAIIFGKQYDLDEGDEGDKGNLKQKHDKYLLGFSYYLYYAVPTQYFLSTSYLKSEQKSKH